MKPYGPIVTGITVAAVCLGLPLLVSAVFAFSRWPEPWQLLDVMGKAYFRTMVGTLLTSILLGYMFIRTRQ